VSSSVRSSVRDDLFLLAHDDDGRLLISEPNIGAGLAGGTLIDLLLDGRVGVNGERLVVLDSGVTGDAQRDGAVQAIESNVDPTGPRAWVSWIAADAYEATAAVLEADGYIQSTSVRRLGVLTSTRCTATNIEDLVRLRSRIRYGVQAPQPQDQRTAALCGLLRVLRLHGSLLLSMPSGELLTALDRMAAPVDTNVRQVLIAVQAVVGAATHR